MGKGLPAKYNPGELDNTRKNIGSISAEEAKKMSALLGGEVGIEKTDAALKSRYDRMKSTTGARATSSASSARKSPSTQSRPNTGASSKAVKSAPKKNATSYAPVKTKKQNEATLRYLDRIKIDTMATRPEHRIKTKGSLVSTYMSIIVKGKDRINPDFLIEGDIVFFNHIEILKASLETLLKKIDPKIFKTYINPYYRTIYRAIFSWDLEILSEHLSALQQHPRRKEITNCSTLCKTLYKPIIILKNCKTEHIAAAVNRLYRVLQIVNANDADELTSLQKTYLELNQQIPIVFDQVAFTCFP
ncbi:MAG: hypothetical protein PQJ46_03120, partial [Spirochaetales bacterium]|nr:hypothetical protein [Spirochaetales bacterium]